MQSVLSAIEQLVVSEDCSVRKTRQQKPGQVPSRSHSRTLALDRSQFTISALIVSCAEGLRIFRR